MISMKNAYEVREDYVAIFINRKDGSTVETWISIEDLPLVDSFPNMWTVRGSYPRLYARVNDYSLGRDNPLQFMLHRQIMGNPTEGVVDHINRNTLDNRRCNLRVISVKENLQNKSVTHNSMSGMNGVQWNNQRQRWMVCVQVNNKPTRFGQFVNLIDAKRKCNEVRMKYMPLSVVREPIKIDLL
jgi:hypothetical protein